MSLIIKAAQYAELCHRGQLRSWSSVPYIIHPCRVAGKIATHSDADEVMVATGFTHDIFEDCGKTIDELMAATSIEVAHLTLELTNPSKGSTLPRAERKAMDLEHLKKISKKAKIIKLIDREDNLNDFTGAKVSFAFKYIEESEALLDAIGDADLELAQKLKDAMDRLHARASNSDDYVR
jgi:guanosine-3',5'-bis(diphosphate) 3'-pyrophosphohydrolase